MRKFVFPLVLMLVVGFFACKKEDAATPPVDTNPTETVPIENMGKLVEMNQALGWKLFNQEQLAKPGKNVLISPFSVQTFLNMAANAANGNTLDEILKFMDCPNCSLEDLNNFQQNLAVSLTDTVGQPNLTSANAFFYGKKRVEIKAPFVEILSKKYGCTSENVDFDAEQAALDKINGWVNDKTVGKIDRIVDEINSNDIAFLINALHFKGDWAKGFLKEGPGFSFTKKDGSIVSVESIKSRWKFRYKNGTDLNMIDIPFKDSTFSLSCIQNATQNTNPDWHSQITPADWAALFTDLKYTPADITLPKFNLKYDNDLIESFTKLGVQDAFLPSRADFNKLGKGRNGNIFISQIKHKTVLKIDEKGAEGAAVTAGSFSASSGYPPFRFDRPFVVVLRHIPTDALVFMGFVADPSL